MKNIQLVIVFNHRYDANIPFLKKYYSNKFNNLKIIMPFYDGEDRDVIPVKRNVSFNFAGFFCEGYNGYVNDESDYYMFLADDALLNPSFGQDEVFNTLLCGGKKVYITEVKPCNGKNGISWYHSVFMNLPFRNKKDEVLNFIPDFDAALQKAKSYFGDYQECFTKEFYVDDTTRAEYKKQRYRDIFEATKVNGDKIPYPLAGGWSDIVIVHKSILKDFVKLCGIFSSMHMFCEIAIPTALMLLCERDEVCTLSKLKREFGMCQEVLWGDDRKAIVDRYEGDLSKLIQDFSKNKILIHPIKISQWNVSEI